MGFSTDTSLLSFVLFLILKGWKFLFCNCSLLISGVVITPGIGMEFLPRCHLMVSLSAALSPRYLYSWVTTICLTFWRQSSSDSFGFMAQILARVMVRCQFFFPKNIFITFAYREECPDMEVHCWGSIFLVTFWWFFLSKDLAKYGRAREGTWSNGF